MFYQLCYSPKWGRWVVIEKIKRPVFRLCNDSVFKELFSKVPNALILLVSDVLKIDYNIISKNTKVELANELHKTRDKNKTTICDFVIKVGNNFRINVELNQNYYKGLHERNLLYAGRILSDTIPKGTKYEQLPKYKVFQLNINTFKNFNGKVIMKAKLLDEATCMPLTEAFSLYNFDIAKCYDIYYNKVISDIDIDSKVIKWGTILYTKDISEISDIMGDDLMSREDKERFIEVITELDEENRTFTDEEIIQLTEWKFEAERLAARDDGIKKGIKEGIKEEKHNTVVNMLNKNLDITLISEITSLNEEEIIKIRESL